MNAVAALFEMVPSLARGCHPILGRRGPWLPLPNVWLLVSCGDQADADKFVPILRDTPAAIRGVSLEPLLGPIILATRGLDWVICGGESGQHARPMHPDWARALRDQCEAAGLPFFFKQWGEWAPFYYRDDGESQKSFVFDADSAFRRMTVHRIGKANAGRLLDGVEHSGFPRRFLPFSQMFGEAV